jgi:transmembrane sensor
MRGSFDHDDRIEEVASDWLTQREAGLSRAQQRAFEHWCRADPRHAAAVARLEAACALLRKMPRVRAELQTVVPFPVKPRVKVPVKNASALRVVLAMAAAVALAALGWWQWASPRPSPQVYATSNGGYERVVLADGSVVELNANSEARIDLAPNQRRVELRRGEAHFTVAPDTARPFVVSAHGVAVQAVGTAFNIRLADAAVEVLVTEGKVAVSDGGPGRSERDSRNGPATPGGPTLLAANQRALVALAPPQFSAAAAPVVELVTSEGVRAALSWQERKLVFSETPLREVVAQFNRRNRLQLILGDAVVSERLMGGTFAADNVEGFLRLLEGSGTIEVERRDDATVVLRAAR